MRSRRAAAWLLLTCLTLLLAGCAGSAEGVPASSGLVRAYSFTVAGTGYTVHRLSGRRNLFRVSTTDGGPGKRYQMARVVRLAYGCHALELTETEPDWQVAEARGAVCTGGYQRFNRTR